MSDKRTHVLGIRINEDAKVELEKRAEEHCMELSQYAKYVLSESLNSSAESEEGKLRRLIKWFDEYYPLLSRMITEGYFKIDSLAREQLYPELVDDIKRCANRQFKKMGILKERIIIKDEEGGKNAKKKRKS